jgi:hypothetical protein
MAPQVDVEDEDKTRTVAKHEYLDGEGKVVDAEEEAKGYRYTLLGNDQSVEWNYDEATEEEKRLYAIFGVKTLCTNESSQIRNNKKLSDVEKNADVQIGAVRERLALIKGGQWVDRTREGGFAVDRPRLATALVNMQVLAKKFGEDMRDEKYADALRRFEEEPGYMAKVRRVPQVSEEYTRLSGKGVVSLDDVL